MSTLVINFVAFGSEGPSAVVAGVGLLAGVGAHMMPQTSSLRKSAVTVRVRACIWLYAKVYIFVP